MLSFFLTPQADHTSLGQNFAFMILPTLWVLNADICNHVAGEFVSTAGVITFTMSYSNRLEV